MACTRSGLTLSMKAAQSIRGAADGEGTEPLPDRGPQADGPRGSGARALSRFFEFAKGDGDDLKSLQRETHTLGSRQMWRRDTPRRHVRRNSGSSFVQWGSGHLPRRGVASLAIIRHCPMDRDAVYLRVPPMDLIFTSIVKSGIRRRSGIL